MKRVWLLFTLMFVSNSFAQNNTISLNQFFKDQLYSSFKGKIYQGGDFLPCLESEFDLPNYIRDSSKQYYLLTSLLYKKHLIELKGDDYYITFSPTIELSVGRNKEDSIQPRKFQNTRGFIIEGDFFKNFSFSSSFYENQARFTEYQTDYFISNGELYPTYNSYSPQNAVIPGGARTKPFKDNGFDYAYAFGNIAYKVNNRLTLLAGNNSHFIGAGYRSLLLSDNSFNSPYIQSNYKLSSKWDFTYLRSKLMNLMRRQYTSSAEAYYIPKALSVNYLTYKPTEKLVLSLFEGIIWSKGDSIASKSVKPLFYNPVPLLGTLIQNDKYNIIGLNVKYRLSDYLLAYSQLSTAYFLDFGFQIGVRKYASLLGVNNMMVQLEYNTVPSNLYESSDNHLLSYSNGNLPLAHVLGSGFHEFISRVNYEYKRFYIDFKFIFTALRNYQVTRLNGFSSENIEQNGGLQNHAVEVGYRFNRKVNLSVFGAYIYRNDQSTSTPITQFFSFGLKTALTNRYTDF